MRAALQLALRPRRLLQAEREVARVAEVALLSALFAREVAGEHVATSPGVLPLMLHY